MSDYTAAQQALIAANRKIPTPIINLPSGAIPLPTEVEAWILIQPNDVLLLLINLIDQTLQNHSTVAEDEQRLMGELAQTSSKILQQRNWVFNEQVASFSNFNTYIAQGLSVTGDPETGQIPPTLLDLINLIRYPISSLMIQYNACDYEDRLNTFQVAARNNTDYLTADTDTLSAWRDLISQYASGVGPSPAISTLASSMQNLNSSSILKRSSLASDSQTARQIALQTAQAQSYSTGRLLAQLYQESSYNPTLVNPTTGAAGLAQFMPGTGPSYGLVETADFFDPEKSSQACIRYMRTLQKLATKWGAASEHDSWLIALAAYDHGQGALERNINNAGLPTNGSVKLSWNQISSLTPYETQNYVYKISQMENNPA